MEGEGWRGGLTGEAQEEVHRNNMVKVEAEETKDWEQKKGNWENETAYESTQYTQCHIFRVMPRRDPIVFLHLAVSDKHTL